MLVRPEYPTCISFARTARESIVVIMYQVNARQKYVVALKGLRLAKLKNVQGRPKNVTMIVEGR